MNIHGQWIDPAKAGDIPKLLDQALAGPTKPVLAWVGVKGRGNKTVHVKGRNGETSEIEHDMSTFSQQINELAEQWGGDSSTGGGNEPDIDTAAVYARRRDATQPEQSSQEPESQHNAAPATSLPDPVDVYSRRRQHAAGSTDD